MKIILDTNILLVSIPSKSQYRIIFNQLIQQKFNLIISNDILNEYFEIITQKSNEIIATNIIEVLINLKNVSKQNIYYNWNLINVDKEDNKFLDCYIAGNADFLVTNDKHFNFIKNIDFPQINIINIDEFVNLIQNL